MSKNTTSCQPNQSPTNKLNQVAQQVLLPCESTLEFIRQFARVYHYEPNLDDDLCSFVLN